MTARTAWLFPGQAVELGAVSIFVSESPAVRAQLDAASALANADLHALVRTGAPRLFESRLLQPVLTAFLLGIAEELIRSGARPDACAGHSLGELAALAASGALRPADALRLAWVRGELMGRAAQLHPGGMIALPESDRKTLDLALRTGASGGALAIAAHNAPDEWVLSGDHAALALVAGRFRNVRLRVSGAWHSPAMAPACEGYREALAATELHAPMATFVSGESGAVIAAERIRADLEAQLTRPLDFTRVLAALRDRGVERFVTIGPGKALRSFVRRCLGASFRVLATDSPRDLAATVKELSR